MSNGTLIDEKTATWLKEIPPQLIRITVYGSSPEVYERVTGRADGFYRVDKALTLLADAGITTDISLTVCRYNFDDFEALLDYAQSKPHALTNLDCDMFQPDEKTGRKLDDFALSTEEQESLFEILFRRQGYTYRPTCADDLRLSRMNSENFSQRCAKMPCVAGKCSFAISADGIMQPCTQYSLSEASVSKLGFKNAWVTVRDAVKNYKRSDECLSCEYFGQCNFCASRYALTSGGKNGLPGHVPCNKYARVLPEVIRRKYIGGTTNEKKL